MNKQKHGDTGINWTHVWGRQGYTVNPLRGCTRGCRWVMPDGQVAVCYAETLANRLNKMSDGKLYTHGFDSISYHPETFNKIKRVKQPAGVFMGSMTDWMDSGVDPDHIASIINTMQECDQHIFFTLTKNAPRLKNYRLQIPHNVWVGVSSPPDQMYSHSNLTDNQKSRWWRNSLNNLSGVRVPIRWLSLEPLSWTGTHADNMIEIIREYAETFHWVVIGAASHHRETYQPDRDVMSRLHEVLKAAGVVVFLKNNIDRDLADDVFGGWLSEQPSETFFNLRRDHILNGGL